jgi:predicted dehydrogenase
MKKKFRGKVAEMKKKTDKRIKTAIAGLGRSGWGIHGRLIKPLEDKFDVIAVYDPDTERMKEAEKHFGCESRKTFKNLIEDENVELVIVAVPNKLHSKYSIMAMEAGKHVVCEKPMATSLKAAGQMIECSGKTGKTLAVFQNRRYGADFLKVKEVIESGVLGRPVQIKIMLHSFARRWDWQTLKKFNGGTLNNTGPHPIDQALVLFGEKEEPQVFCHRDAALTLGDADDHVKLILHGKKSSPVEVEITSACAYPQYNWLVMGTKGTLAGTMQKLNWKYFRDKSLPKREVEEKPLPGRGYCKEEIPFIEKTWSREKDKTPGETGFYLDLYETLRNGKPLYITPESVYRQMKVLDKCRKKAPV